MSDDFADLPTIPGQRAGVLSRDDFYMLVTLRSGEVTQRTCSHGHGQLYIKGFSLHPTLPETLRIQRLLKLGVAEVRDDGVLGLTPDAEEHVVRSAAEYGMDLQALDRKVKALDTVEAVRMQNRRERRGRRRG